MTLDRITVLNKSENSLCASGGGWHLVLKFKTIDLKDEKLLSVLYMALCVQTSNVILVHIQVLRTTELLKRSKSSTSRCLDNRAILPLG